MTGHAVDFAEQVAKYEDFVEQTQRWLGKRADRFHWYYNASRLALIVLSVMIPTLSASPLQLRGQDATASFLTLRC